MRRVRLVPFASIVSAAGMVALGAAPCGAQWQTSVDAGFARLKQTGIVESNASMFGANAQYAADHGAFQANALAARSASNGWTAQAVIGGALTGPSLPHARLELDGFVSTFAATSLLPTFTTELMARVRAGDAERGGAIAIGGGTFSHETRTAPLLHAQASLWRAFDQDVLIGEVSFVRTQSALFAASAGAPVPLYTLAYTDVSANWRREYASFSFGATGGLRAELEGGLRSDGWALGDVEAWIVPRAAIVVGLGRTLRDIVHGVPRTHYLSLSLRIAAQPHRALTTRRTAPAGPRLAIERVDESRRRIEVVAPGASRVEIISDFTGWTPLALERNGDRWTTERTVAPGLHRIALRVDGGDWIAPANLPRVTDEMGGVVGLITVP